MINWLKRFFVKKITFPKIDASAVPIGRPPIPQMPVPRAHIEAYARPLRPDGNPYAEYADPYLSTLAARLGPEVMTWYDNMGHLRWETQEMTVTEENTLPTDMQWPTLDLEEAKKDSDRMKDSSD